MGVRYVSKNEVPLKREFLKLEKSMGCSAMGVAVLWHPWHCSAMADAADGAIHWQITDGKGSTKTTLWCYGHR